MLTIPLSIIFFVLVLLVGEVAFMGAAELVDLVAVVGVFGLLVLAESSHLVSVGVHSFLQFICSFVLFSLHFVAELRHFRIMPFLRLLRFRIMPFLGGSLLIIHLFNLSSMIGLQVSNSLNSILLSSSFFLVEGA